MKNRKKINETQHTFENFIKNERKLKTVFEYENPQTGQNIEIKYKNTGKHLLCIDYSVKFESISKSVIAVYIDDKASMSVIVNGTNGRQEKAYMDFNSQKMDGSIMLSFPQIVYVDKITVMQ